MPRTSSSLLALAFVATIVAGGAEFRLRRMELSSAGSPAGAASVGPAATAQAAQPEVLPIPAAMTCVLGLATIFILLHTALAVCRIAYDSWGLKYATSPVDKVLRAACMDAGCAPMLAVLFLGCHMHVRWLSMRTEDVPDMVQMNMWYCSASVVLLTLCPAAVHYFGSTTTDPDVARSSTDTVQPRGTQCTAVCISAIKFIILVFLYVSIGCVAYGTYTYEPPANTWPENKIPPSCATIRCIVLLACQFFLFYGLLQLAHMYSLAFGTRMLRLESMMMTASHSCDAAPMLAALFVAAWVRMAQMDPTHLYLQPWAQNCVYTCTYGVAVHTLLSILVPLVMHGEVDPGSPGRVEDADPKHVVHNKTVGTVLVGLRYITLLTIYVSCLCVVASMSLIEHPKGGENTLPLSITMRCVVILTLQFFAVYFALMVFETQREFAGSESSLTTQALDKARATVAFCPMLAAVFISTRARALQITNNWGVPQSWIEDGMNMATGAVLIQLLLVSIASVSASASSVTASSMGKEGSRASNGRSPEVLRIGWIALMFLYIGLVTVMIGFFVMSPRMDQVLEGASAFFADPADLYVAE